MSRTPFLPPLVVALCLAAGFRMPAQSSHLIYSDSLQNSWEDWSWSTNNLNNATPVHSGTKSISVTCGAWQAVSLAHSAFGTAPYTNFGVWAHGGSEGRQNLRIAALRSAGNPTGYTWVGPLA